MQFEQDVVPSQRHTDGLPQLTIKAGDEGGMHAK
jgi:hypothetical protein